MIGSTGPAPDSAARLTGPALGYAATPTATAGYAAAPAPAFGNPTFFSQC